MLLAHCERREDSRADCTAGNSSATSTPMIAITTSSSTSVKAERRRGDMADLLRVIRHLSFVVGCDSLTIHFFVTTSKLNLNGPWGATSIVCWLLVFQSGGTLGFGEGGS